MYQSQSLGSGQPSLSIEASQEVAPWTTLPPLHQPPCHPHTWRRYNSSLVLFQFQHGRSLPAPCSLRQERVCVCVCVRVCTRTHLGQVRSPCCVYLGKSLTLSELWLLCLNHKGVRFFWKLRHGRQIMNLALASQEGDMRALGVSYTCMSLSSAQTCALIPCHGRPWIPGVGRGLSQKTVRTLRL